MRSAEDGDFKTLPTVCKFVFYRQCDINHRPINTDNAVQQFGQHPVVFSSCHITVHTYEQS